MKIKILEITPNAIEVLYRAFRTCVSECPPSEIELPIKQGLTGMPYDYEKMIDLFKRHINHESVLEHVNITFSVEEVSRSLSHQLVRHRISSYTQQSQRYVRLGQFEYVMPPEVEKDPALKLMFEDHMIRTQELYDYITKALVTHGRTEKQAIEDARYVFPNACCTNLIWTCNLREFRHFYAERICKHAQWEIREMAEKAMQEVKKHLSFADYKSKKCGLSCFECYVIEGD